MRRSVAVVLSAAAVGAVAACQPPATNPAPRHTTAGAKPVPAPTRADKPKPTAQITSCENDDFGYPHAKVTITNTTSEQKTINVQVAFTALDGTRLADGYAMVNNLAPGQKAAEEAMGLKQVKGKYTCTVINVDRW